MKLLTRTFLYMLALMLAVAAIAHIFLYAGLPRAYDMQQQHLLASQASKLLRQLPQEDEAQRAASIASFAAQWTADVSAQIGEYSFHADLLPGTAVPASEASSSAQVVTERTETGLRISLAEHSLGGADCFRLEEHLPDGSGFLEATVSRQHIEDVRGVLMSFLPVTAGVSVILCAIFAFLYARRLTKPMRAIGDCASRMRTLDPDIRCPDDGSDEVGQLAQDVNALYASLLATIEALQAQMERAEAADAARINLLRSASHELKTPVTAARVMLENMLLGIGRYADRDKYLGKCLGLMDQLTQMVQDILDASSLDAAPGCEDFAVEDVLRDILEPYRLLAKAKNIALRVTALDPICVHLPQAPLRNALGSLLSNAAAYTDPGGSIHILLSKKTLTIRNTCKALPEDQLARVFDPFYRAPGASLPSGSGLGLYFVSAILDSLRLAYSFGAAPDFPGMEFRISF